MGVESTLWRLATMNLYAQAYSLDVRTDQNRVIEMLLDAKQNSDYEKQEAIASPTIVP
jgi:hypothetical protein